MFKKDWFERQIEAVAKTFSALIFGRDKVMDVLGNSDEMQDLQSIAQNELLRSLLKKKVSQGNINEAEDLLFENVKKDPSPGNLIVALEFYNNLNELSDEMLTKCDFSRDEIVDGINGIKFFYEIG